MPNIKDESTVKAIAREFVANGRNKGEALQAVGYSNAYAVDGGRGCAVVFSNVRVIEAIAELDAELSAKTAYTVAQCQREYEEARTLAMDIKQPAAAATAITGKARLYGFDKDNHSTEQTVIIINPPKQAKTVESEVLE